MSSTSPKEPGDLSHLGSQEGTATARQEPLGTEALSKAAVEARREVPEELRDHLAHLLRPSQRSSQQRDWAQRCTPSNPLDALCEASLAVTSSLEPEEVLDAILIHVISLSGADDAYIFYYDGKVLTFAAHRWRDGLRHRRGPFKEPRPNGLTHAVASSGRPLVVPDVEHHPLFEDWRWSGALLGLPLTIRDQVLGVMTIGFGAPQQFAGEALRLLDLLADQAAIAIQNAALHSRMKKELRDRRRAEARYQRLVDHLPTIICELTPEGTTTFVSPAITALTGHRPEDLLGRNWWETLFSSEEKEHIALLRKRLQREDISDHEMTLMDLEQTPHVFTWSTANQWHGNGELKRIIMIGMDVTMRRRAEEEHRQLQEQLIFAQRMDCVGRLASGVAHDFNNLLTVILGCAQMLKDALDDESPLMEDVREIIGSSKRGAALARQLLLYSRKDIAEPRAVNINRVVRGMGKLLERLIDEQISLDLRLSRRLPSVCIDPGHLEQVIVNLVVNACDAMPQGGNLGIVTEVCEMDEELVRRYASVCAGSHVRLAVTDTGCGMSEDVAASVFEPFFTTKPREKGTGLGLSTVYGIVKQAKGSIWVHTEPENGSTFEIFLPVVGGKDLGHPASTTEAPAIGRGEVLLLVEDDDALRMTMARVLSNLGYRVQEAADGAQAWSVFRKLEGAVDLLITDLVMPDLSGPKLIARIRDSAPLLSVLCISGHPTAASNEDVEGQGRTSFLRKPFTPSRLAAKVSEMLRQSR